MQPFDNKVIVAESIAKDTATVVLNQLEKLKPQNDDYAHPTQLCEEIYLGFANANCLAKLKEYFPQLHEDTLKDAANHFSMSFMNKYQRKKSFSTNFKWYDIVNLILPIILDLIKKIVDMKKDEDKDGNDNEK